MTKVTRSVRMFLEYLQAKPAERVTYHLFQNFVQRLYTGTFDRGTGLVSATNSKKKVGLLRDTDTNLGWVERKYPHMAA